jgi:two-component system, cell cycle sensor histidine kinase and response regulator CckA
VADKKQGQILNGLADLTPEETRAWLAAIIDSSDDAIVSKNLESIVRSWNAGAQRLFGYSAEEMIGHSITRIIPQELITEESEILARLRRGERVEHFETVRVAKDGQRVHVSLTISPIKDSTGRVIGASKIARDITKRKETEAALQQASMAIAQLNEDLESRVRERTSELERATDALRRESEQQKTLEAQLRQAQKMESVGTLAGGIAHDFNNILNIILGYSAAISSERDPARIADNVKVIRDTVERGANVVQQLLAIGRKASITFDAIDLNKLLENHSVLLQGSFPKTIEIHLRLDPALPLAAGDTNRLNQAVLNLCVNARDAMSGAGAIELGSGRIGGAILRTRFPDATGAEYVWISISDSGPGIEGTMLERIFEPFFTTKPQGEGSGLGLAVVYGIVKDHNGFVEVESERDQGATFRIFLPEYAGEAAEAAANIKDAAPLVPAPLRRGTVLIADDEENQLRLMERFLGTAGYDVLTARDGLQAVELFRRHRDSIVVAVLDLGLPKLSGWDSYDAMRQNDPSLRVLFASGYIEPEVKRAVEDNGAADIVKKPYQPDELMAKIDALVERSRR